MIEWSWLFQINIIVKAKDKNAEILSRQFDDDIREAFKDWRYRSEKLDETGPISEYVLLSFRLSRGSIEDSEESLVNDIMPVLEKYNLAIVQVVRDGGRWVLTATKTSLDGHRYI